MCGTTCLYSRLGRSREGLVPPGRFLGNRGRGFVLLLAEVALLLQLEELRKRRQPRTRSEWVVRRTSGSLSLTVLV